jgi:hypothetical protein
LQCLSLYSIFLHGASCASCGALRQTTSVRYRVLPRLSHTLLFMTRQGMPCHPTRMLPLCWNYNAMTIGWILRWTRWILRLRRRSLISICSAALVFCRDSSIRETTRGEQRAKELWA